MYRLLLPLILYYTIAMIIIMIMRFLLERSWEEAVRKGGLVFAGLALIDQILFRFFDVEVARVIMDVFNSLN